MRSKCSIAIAWALAIAMCAASGCRSESRTPGRTVTLATPGEKSELRVTAVHHDPNDLDEEWENGGFAD